MSQPIKVKAHSLIDYGFAAVGLGGPLVLGLRGPGRALPLGFAAIQGTLNAFTDQPYAVKRLVPFKLHGLGEAVAVPALAVASLATGALSEPRSRAFLGGMLAALGTVYALTDWDAKPPRRFTLRRR